MTDNLSSLFQSLYVTRQQKNVLDKTEKAILAEIKPLVDPEFDHLALVEEAGPGVPIVSSNLELFRVSGTSRSISAELLLARGVSPDIVSYATKTTTYFQYRIKEVKEDSQK